MNLAAVSLHSVLLYAALFSVSSPRSGRELLDHTWGKTFPKGWKTAETSIDASQDWAELDILPEW